MRPNEFYVGVIDFFAVLVPGSISTAILVEKFHSWIIKSFGVVLQGSSEKGIAFLVCAYFIGHLIFLAGSYIDEQAYDPLRKWILLQENELEDWLKNDAGSKEKQSICGRLIKKYLIVRNNTEKALNRATKLHQIFNRLFIKVKTYAKMYQCVKEICDAFFCKEQDTSTVLRWVRSVLLITCSEAVEEVRRLEADSKFFRSMIVVCLLAASSFLCGGSIVEYCVALILAVLCFIRYVERRLKAMTQACIHVITLHQLNKLPKHSCLPDVSEKKITN